MALSIDRERVDEFCPQLFRVLDSLGIFPLHLRAKPTEFEKYPRLLFGSIQRYEDVEAGFREWESRLLRGVESPAIREACYPQIEALRQWMIQHRAVFTKKPNMQHLRTGLYARVFQYLYPRRILVNAYCEKHRGNTNAIETEFIEKALPDSIAREVQKLQETYSSEWGIVVTDAKAILIAKAAYYRKVLRGEETIAPPEEDHQAVQEGEPEEVGV